MEVKYFKKQAELDNFTASLKSNTFYKILGTEKNLFRTTTSVLVFNEKDIEEYLVEKFHQILETLGIKDFKEKVYLNDNKFYIKFSYEESSFLLKRYGYIISAIQNLLSNYIFVKFSKWFQIIINVNNHLHNQKYFLKKQIYFAIKNIKTTNKPFHFKPMPNDQRRIVHELIKEMEGFTSHSEGNGYLRHIVIKKNTDEIIA